MLSCQTTFTHKSPIESASGTSDCSLVSNVCDNVMLLMCSFTYNLRYKVADWISTFPQFFLLGWGSRYVPHAPVLSISLLATASSRKIRDTLCNRQGIAKHNLRNWSRFKRAVKVVRRDNAARHRFKISEIKTIRCNSKTTHGATSTAGWNRNTSYVGVTKTDRIDHKCREGRSS